MFFKPNLEVIASIFAIVLLASASATTTSAATTTRKCTRTVRFEQVPTDTPLAKFNGLVYHNFAVTTEQDGLTPASGKRYLTGDNVYARIEMPVDSKDIAFIIDSFDFGCVGGPAPSNIYPEACSLTMISTFPAGFAYIQSMTINYTDYNKTSLPSSMQHFRISDDSSDHGGTMFGGQTIYFFLSGGLVWSSYFIDNFVYSFFPCLN